MFCTGYRKEVHVKARKLSEYSQRRACAELKYNTGN